MEVAIRTPQLLSLLLLGCGAPTPEPVPEPAPVRVRPPVFRLAEHVDAEPEELLERADTAEPAAPEPPPAMPMPAERAAEYDAPVAKPFAHLQPWRREVALGSAATLVDLHPRIHRQFLLTVGEVTYNLENRDPGRILVDLDTSDETGLALVHLDDEEVLRCAPWEGALSPLAKAKSSGLPYVPICEDHLLVRNTAAGRRTTVEWAAEFLRARGGDHLVETVKSATQDRFRKEAVLGEEEESSDGGLGPAPIRLATAKAPSVARGDMALLAKPDKLPAGQWTELPTHPGLHVAVIAPGLAALPESEEQRALVDSKDALETGAVAYLVAIDLDSHRLEFELGTEHPAVGWSTRAAKAQVDASRPGPDGIGSLEPFARAGQVPPVEAVHLVASFTGGFKREHAAFVKGALSERNGASHYGVIQDGLVTSKLQPGLATLVVYDDGQVEIRTWSESLDAELDRVLHARQNGVPLLDGGLVSPLISDWRAGNWSGSATGDSRTIRAGACVQSTERGRYLVYGYFTAATPKSMARVFLAAGCTEAMHLDMNALEHTYMATYERDEAGKWTVRHLDAGMAVLDKKDRKGTVLPRFVAFPDNRDFFTVVRRAP